MITDHRHQSGFGQQLVDEERILPGQLLFPWATEDDAQDATQPCAAPRLDEVMTSDDTNNDVELNSDSDGSQSPPETSSQPEESAAPQRLHLPTQQQLHVDNDGSCGHSSACRDVRLLSRLMNHSRRTAIRAPLLNRPRRKPARKTAKSKVQEKDCLN